jgi:hypothetical protein
MALLTAKKQINNDKRSALKNVLLITLLTGTLDGAVTLATNYIQYKTSPSIIFRFIAAGAYGEAAFNSGSEMVISGIFFHYTIAFLFTTVFYQLYPVFKSAFKNKYLIGILYGLLAWFIMNMAVVPLSKIGAHHIKLEYILSGMAILVICLGLPITLIADWQYSKKLSGKT